MMALPMARRGPEDLRITINVKLMKTKLIGSSGDLGLMTVLLNKFYYTSSIRIEGEEVFNSKGKIQNVRVVLKKGRYRFEHILQS